MGLNIICCSRIEGKGVPTTIAQNTCILFDGRDENTLANLSRSETDGLLVMKMLRATEMTVVSIAAGLANVDQTNNRNDSIKTGN